MSIKGCYLILLCLKEKVIGEICIGVLDHCCDVIIQYPFIVANDVVHQHVLWSVLTKPVS